MTRLQSAWLGHDHLHTHIFRIHLFETEICHCPPTPSLPFPPYPPLLPFSSSCICIHIHGGARGVSKMMFVICEYFFCGCVTDVCVCVFVQEWIDECVGGERGGMQEMNNSTFILYNL